MSVSQWNGKEIGQREKKFKIVVYFISSSLKTIVHSHTHLGDQRPDQSWDGANRIIIIIDCCTAGSICLAIVAMLTRGTPQHCFTFYSSSGHWLTTISSSLIAVHLGSRGIIKYFIPKWAFVRVVSTLVTHRELNLENIERDRSQSNWHSSTWYYFPPFAYAIKFYCYFCNLSFNTFADRTKPLADNRNVSGRLAKTRDICSRFNTTRDWLDKDSSFLRIVCIPAWFGALKEENAVEIEYLAAF